MKIGITCWPTFGGSGVVASELGLGLAERGHEVHFITYDVPGRLDMYRPGIFYHEVTVPDYPLFEFAPYSLALAAKIAETAKREKLDIIHAHYAIPHATSSLLAKEIVGRDRLKVVTTLHGTDITLVGRDSSFMNVTKYSIEKSDQVSAVSKFLSHEVCRVFTCDKDVRTIYNFIDPRVYENLNPHNLRCRFAPNDEKVLVHISNFRAVKRVDVVVKIFLQIRQQISVKLVLVGNGPEMQKVEALVHEGDADHDVIKLGNQNSIEDIISASDLLLLPSQTESFGLVALEAMACGIPPVVTAVGGLPEVVEDDLTGVIVPLGEDDVLAQRAYELLTDNEKRLRIGRQARDKALNDFGIEAALDAYEDMYRAALQS